MRGSESFVRRGGSKFDLILVDDGIYDPNTAINGPSSETPFKWHFAGGLMMAQH